jgi:Heparinase II/III-like protein/Heparinase II/III N-terminus
LAHFSSSAVRSRREIFFRIRQETANLAMLARPPVPPAAVVPERLLPDPIETATRLRGSSFAREVESLARRILQHRFPVLGVEIETGPQIEWRRDHIHGISSGLPYSRRLHYLDFNRVGDHKIVWELNRHQQLVLLAQAFRFTDDRAYLDEAFRQLESWLSANPFLHGINWASALEVAFRSLSWIWFALLAKDLFPRGLNRRFQAVLYQHGCFLEHNLSVFFSPNTHLLGEAVALHALGVLFPDWPRSSVWKTYGDRVVQLEIERQVRPDGSHFEQSAYYHVYALDFFLFHRALAQSHSSYDARLQKMAEYLHALLGPSGVLPYFGDDDGGRVFHPYGDRSLFACATLATCGALFARPEWIRHAEDHERQADWWFGPSDLQPFPLPHSFSFFPNAGVSVMAAEDRQIVVKAGPFGEGSGGHSHSDILSMVARIGSREILIDPGTYTYVADPAERDRFRSAAAHNTVRIDERDQATPAGPFRWLDKPVVRVVTADGCSFEAFCTYRGFTHRRRIRFLEPDLVVVLDIVEGPPGDHQVEQFWHLAAAADAARLSFSASAERLSGWRSRALGSREASSVLRVEYRGPLPTQMAAVLDLSDNPLPSPVTLQSEDGHIAIAWHSGTLLL